MEILTHLMQGFALLANWVPLLIIVVGVMLGILVGVLPGLSPAMGVALLVPFSYGLDPLYGLPFMQRQTVAGRSQPLPSIRRARRQRLSPLLTVIRSHNRANQAERSALQLLPPLSGDFSERLF